MAREKAKAKTKRTRGRKKRGETMRVVEARVAKYHALFSQLFADPNPKKRYPGYEALGAELGFSKSMVRRDIKLMQVDYNLPLEFMEEYGGWGYTEAVLNSPTTRMTKSELVLICTAWKALESFKGGPYAEQVASAFEKLLQGLGPGVMEDLRKIRDRISFRATSYYAPVDLAVFEEVSAGLMDEEEVKFDYCKLKRAATDGAPEIRHVHPRHLLHYDGAWYLFTDDAKEGNRRRKFALSRMETARRIGKRFTPLEPFDIEQELGPGFGVHSGTPETVRLRFHGMMAQLVSERHYHGTQSISENMDETVELELLSVIGPELKRWVLGAGGEVEVLEPETLREELLREAEKMVEGFQQGSRRNGRLG